ncbi:MAG TPA: glycosyltransferase family 39 protein [Rubrobacter sp.]|nr:glycosyltransferase family 39 protein [Rubrobacter sp.]
MEDDRRGTKGVGFFREPLPRLLVLGALLAAAFSVRVYGISRPPMEFFSVRQYHGALLARGFYEWLLTGSLRTFPPDGIIEPPILELLASLAYLVSGGEHLWMPRLLSALFWMAGGVFLYLVARKLVPPSAAVFSVAFYLFVPYGVFASRALMPDPLMVMLLVAGVLAVLRYHERPSMRRLLVAAAASSLAVLVKPGICLFQLFGAFVALAVYRRGVRGTLLDAHTLAFAALAALPTCVYFLYGTVFAGFLRGQTSSKIVPRLLLEPSYWEGWQLSVWLVVGNVALLGGLLGVILPSEGSPRRALLVGLWGGYLLFGLTFTFHIHTHSYYSLQLVPAVALSLAAVATSVTGYLGRIGLRSYGGAAVLGVTLAALALGLAEHKWEISQIVHQDSVATVYASNVATYHEIGDAVDHSRRTLVLFAAYPSGESRAGALMYHGRLAGRVLPSPVNANQTPTGGGGAGSEGRLRRRLREYAPEYFVVSEYWWRAPETGALRRLVAKDFHRSSMGPGYVVFRSDQ